LAQSLAALSAASATRHNTLPRDNQGEKARQSG
jgi:hypothetical protein